MKFLLPLLVLGACVTADEEPTNVISLEVDSSNGTSLNGTSLNGTSLNGTSLNGTSLNGTSLNGTSLNGTSLNGTSLNGTSLNGTSLNGTSLNGTSVVGSKNVGATWSGTSSNGAPVKLRIDSAAQGTGTNTDVWFYTVSFQTSAGWSPLCGLSGTTPVQAIAVPGVWTGTANNYAASTTQFTWACRQKTVAKCVELGYKPWKSYGPQLASCVRLLRADYCGDGTSYTRDGTLLNLYDRLGIQTDAEAWDFEAGWGPNGAVCVGSAIDQRAKLLGLTKPPCWTALKTQSCASALLIDELAPIAP